MTHLSLSLSHTPVATITDNFGAGGISDSGVVDKRCERLYIVPHTDARRPTPGKRGRAGGGTERVLRVSACKHVHTQGRCQASGMVGVFGSDAVVWNGVRDGEIV